MSVEKAIERIKERVAEDNSGAYDMYDLYSDGMEEALYILLEEMEAPSE